MTGTTNKIQIQVLYFASLGEALNTAQESIELSGGDATVKQLIAQLTERGAAWQKLQEASTQCAVNQTLANAGTELKTGDEVAFFPPVTGG